MNQRGLALNDCLADVKGCVLVSTLFLGERVLSLPFGVLPSAHPLTTLPHVIG
jgi:hypothetical protein